MTRSFNANPPVIEIRQSTDPGSHNEYADLPPVKGLAKWVCYCRDLRLLVCRFVSTQGFNHGYAREAPGQDSKMARLLTPLKEQTPHVPGINAAITHCNEIADAFETAAQAETNTRKLAGLFTAAISEAIVEFLLSQPPRHPNRTIKDASVLEDGSTLNSRNIDFFYAADPADQAEAYECKNSPTGVFSEAMGLRSHPDKTKQRAWKRSKLFLMETLKSRLEDKDIPTHLGLISLRSEATVQARLKRMAEEMGVAIPGIIAVYGREALFAYIPSGNWKPVFVAGP